MLPRNRLLFAAAVLVELANAQSSSYWVFYEGDAPPSCVVPASDMVDESCCTEGPFPGFLISDIFTSTCFVILGLLGDSGESLQSYLGCDDGAPIYGEACYNDGENGGIIPAGTIVNPSNATNIEECGCQFQVSGNGCHKILDYSSLPGFEDDTRQAFLFMNETCSEAERPVSAPVSDPVSKPVSAPVEAPVSTPISAPISEPTSSATDNKPAFKFATLAIATALFAVIFY